MEVGKDFLERTRQLQFDRIRNAKDWWKELSEEGQRAAYAAWLEANPEDFRSKWGFSLASISKNSIECIWEHCKEKSKAS